MHCGAVYTGLVKGKPLFQAYHRMIYLFHVEPGVEMQGDRGSVESDWSELLVELLMVRRLIERPQGAKELCAWMQCSVPTLKRRIDDVRGLGAHVESLKVGRQWVYHVANASMLEPRLSRWIELERQRSLVDANHE